MAYGPKGERSSHMVGLVSQAGHYHLSVEAAHTIIDHQIATIETQWDEVCDLANLTTVDRETVSEADSSSTRTLSTSTCPISSRPRPAYLLVQKSGLVGTFPRRASR